MHYWCPSCRVVVFVIFGNTSSLVIWVLTGFILSFISLSISHKVSLGGLSFCASRPSFSVAGERCVLIFANTWGNIRSLIINVSSITSLIAPVIAVIRRLSAVLFLASRPAFRVRGECFDTLLYIDLVLRIPERTRSFVFSVGNNYF